MITIKVTGGIGNQLFQYALGYTLKTRFNKEVQFDISFYKTIDINRTVKRDLEIEAFNVAEFNKVENSGLKNDSLSKLARLAERTFLPYYKQSYIVEDQLKFDPNIFRVKNNAHLNGYWQSPKYFEAVGPDLRKQLILKNGLSERASIFNEIIKNAENSISIHVRRGDYLAAQKLNYKHLFFIQDADYYARGISYIKNKIKTDKVTLFVFSDDIEWCKKHLKYNDEVVFVNNEGMYPYEDMILMAWCKHNIIANSSYSWWGAWLNDNATKTVVGPQNWFVENPANDLFTNDAFPASWVVL